MTKAKRETMKPFKLNGKPVAMSRMCPLGQQIKAFLDSQPADEMGPAFDRNQNQASH
jgi:hypothetical protein